MTALFLALTTISMVDSSSSYSVCGGDSGLISSDSSDKSEIDPCQIQVFTDTIKIATRISL